MTVQEAVLDGSDRAFLAGYLDMLGLVERLHRLLLDVIKDEFKRLGIEEVNPVQGLLLFNIGEHEVSAGELKTRGYYQGSNVSYNLKKLVESGYMHHQRSEADRRSVRVRLTEKGRIVYDGPSAHLTPALLRELYGMQADEFLSGTHLLPSVKPQNTVLPWPGPVAQAA